LFYVILLKAIKTDVLVTKKELLIYTSEKEQSLVEAGNAILQHWIYKLVFKLLVCRTNCFNFGLVYLDCSDNAWSK